MIVQKRPDVEDMNAKWAEVLVRSRELLDGSQTLRSEIARMREMIRNDAAELSKLIAEKVDNIHI